MTRPATDRSMITTTHRSGTETGNSSGGRAARQNSGPDGVRREPPSSAGKPLHGAVLLAALGIVYGDIGTSPIYTFRECLKAGSDGEVVLGLLSLIFWSLTIVVTTKYVLFVMRADNHGEGGIMALLGLAAHSEPDLKRRSALILLGIAGAALFYGDGMITPAISVLSAIEGLKVATPVLAPYVVPISLVVLLGLFLLQRSGSDRIGRYFGPVMGLWFLGLAISGLVQIIQSPSVLAALNPVHALSFLAQHGATGFVALGSVFLALTGAEALYADMGHFGRAPIRVDWFGIVLPALVLNYFGQGALVLAHPDAADSPFYRLFPDWLLYPMTLLATAATVIASQAVISGAGRNVDRPGLRATDQLAACAGRDRIGLGIPIVGSVGGGLRHRRRHHHAGHHRAPCGRCTPIVGLE